MQSSLGRAVDNMADDFIKAGKEVSKDVSNTVYNPIVSDIALKCSHDYQNSGHFLCDPVNRIRVGDRKHVFKLWVA